MGENAELQEEELEVLKSIYDGDENYSSTSDTSHNYKYGEYLKSKSFLMEIKWPESYPSTLPEIVMDSFYNKHLLPEVSAGIKASVLEEADQFLGMSMTYSLFEYVKENFDSLLENQPDFVENISEKVEKIALDDDENSEKVKVKKEQYTKNQKRRMWDKGGINEDDRSRGWDWIDVVKHLHQTGAGQQDED